MGFEEEEIAEFQKKHELSDSDEDSAAGQSDSDAISDEEKPLLDIEALKSRGDLTEKQQQMV